MAEEVFKNIRVLKGIPVDEFMGTMGVFSAALGMSCEDCHSASDTTWENYALDTSPRKVTARRMVQMMASINQASFGGRQVVTCYTCHRGSETPEGHARASRPCTARRCWTNRTTSSSAAPERPAADSDSGQIHPGARRRAAAGRRHQLRRQGNQRRLRSGRDRRPIEIFAKAPDQRTTIIHTLDGDSTTAYDGRAGWIAAPHKPVPVLPLTGGELDGVRLDAELSFPARIKETLRDWRVGLPTEIDDKTVQVVQGTRRRRARDVLLRYRDGPADAAGPLRQFARSAGCPRRSTTPIIATSSGVKMPFKFKVTWLDGLENVELTDVQLNVPVDAAKFGKPAAPPQ